MDLLVLGGVFFQNSMTQLKALTRESLGVRSKPLAVASV